MDEEYESENLSPSGNRKEVHYHSNGSNKIVWAWAGATTALAVALMTIYVIRQSAIDDRQDEYIDSIRSSVIRVEEKANANSREIERLRQ